MKKNYFPDYYGGSVLNLMSSIGKAIGFKSKYNTLKILNSKEISNKNIVLIVMDGLGYEYIMKNGKNTIFQKYLVGKITSGFPSATTAIIPIFFTGKSCLEHGMVSWHSYSRESKLNITPLPYINRINPKIKLKEPISKVFNLQPITKKVKLKSYILTKKEIRNSDFSLTTGKKSKILGYKNTKDFFKKLENIIKLGNRKYVLAYFPYHDSLSHDYGVKSKKTLANFKKTDRELKKFLEKIKNHETTIIITADHGSIDVPKSRKIKIKNHPKLKETLVAPICGDNRADFCFVKPEKRKQFEDYIKTKLGKYCDVYKSKSLIRKGYFGIERPTKKFLERIGDYTIIMKDNYGIYQKLPNEGKKYNIGEHGGLSSEEMFVPLVVIKR